ncbi:uncharacterized protein LOC110848425 isoform X1 [Folsomia candida]|uniref:uncharacterized protein LOC110848425 isoform X1 n=1 Tax=Folsomia candida TaxID=158441 RepID=UPI001604B5DB|nr:uncharacterized protein LOC110848425 isoform X1 [Folsomia candida]
MPCSAVTLSLATIAAVISVALLAISFSTDNWIRIDVRRNKIKERVQNDPSSIDNPDDLQDNPLYFTRTKGLFRVCFPTPERPSSSKVALYLSPVETYCMNIDYFIPDEDNVTADFTPDQMNRLHMGRSAIALFILAFFFVFIAFWTGVAGCWRRSSGNITATAILMLLTCLFSAGGMGLWHGVEYYETEKLSGSEYFKDWPQALKASSVWSYDWSYVLAWIGVGWSLVAALLFSGAAVCLRGEAGLGYPESQHMHYLMPVYPQKQPGYAAYGYATAYPPGYGYGNSYPQYSNY